MTGSQTPTPTAAQLMDWLENRLPADQATTIAQAVERSAALQQQVAWLAEFLQLSRGLVLADPPTEVRQAAVAAFAAHVQAQRPPSLLQRLTAALTADSWQRLSLAGVRNVTLRTDPRQLIFSSDLADVALNIHVERGGQDIALDGQIFPLNDVDPAGFVVQLLQGGIERRLTTSDAAGKFSLTELPAGEYELVIAGDQAEIELGPIALA